MDGFFFYDFFVGISAVLWTFGHTQKTPPQNSPPHPCCIRQVSEAGFPTDTHCSASGGQASNLSNSLRKVSPAMGGAKFRWVVSISSRADGSPCRGNTCGKQTCYNIVFVVLGGSVGSSQGYIQVTVIGRGA